MPVGSAAGLLFLSAVCTLAGWIVRGGSVVRCVLFVVAFAGLTKGSLWFAVAVGPSLLVAALPLLPRPGP